MTSAVRLQQIVLVAAVIVPAGLFTAAIWQNHEDVLREGRGAIERTAAVMQEHAGKVFETAELVIGQVYERIDDETPEQIRSPQTSAFLARLKAPMDQLVSISVADRDGVMRAGSQPWPPGAGISGREFFQVHKDSPRSIFIGAPFTGLATSAPSFAISWGLRGADNTFSGTIHTAVSPDYFSRFYNEIAPPGEHIALMLLEDGRILARNPALSERSALTRDEPIMKHIAAGLKGGRFTEAGTDGVLYDYAIQRVGGYPVYIAYVVPHSVLLGRWYRNLQIYGVVAAGAAAMLVGVSWLALRRAASEQRALAMLRHAMLQRAEAEEQLRHAQRMDAVGQLTGGMAHDFNNLLTAIMGNLDLIHRSATMPDGRDRIVKLAATAMKAVQRGASLTKSLLAFSRKQPLQPRPIDANALVSDFKDLLRQAVGSTVTIRFEGAPNLPACVADSAELEAALLNLTINARDALKNAGRRFSNGTCGTVTIQTAAVALDAEALAGNPEARPGAFVAIEVGDDGPGMSPEIAAKAFEPFFTTKPIGQGTGLGLSQVFGFARQLGGHVTLESRAGEGTTVTLYIPAA